MGRAAVITIGCRLNQSEGDALRTLLQKDGNQVVTNIFHRPDDSDNLQDNSFSNQSLDTVLVNTCAVTERASRTSIKWIRRCAGLRPKPRLVITGCLATTDSERLKNISGVDEVIGQTAKVKLIENCPILPSRARAFLKIQDGCENHCAYCLPAQIRGKPISKPIRQVEHEFKDLLANNYQEIVLVGLNLGIYGMDSGISLVNLLEKLSQSNGEFRIRLGCLEPDVFDDQILERLDEFRLCRHFHIPLQSGDDKILNLMGRKYTVVQYQRLIEKIVSLVPDVNIGTDLIIGFPTEDELSFNQTLNFIRNLPLAYLHVFPYSARPGTDAFKTKETVSTLEKKERVNRLRNLSQEKSLEYRCRFLDKILPVIIEPKAWVMTDNYIRVYITSGYDGKTPGKLGKVKVTEVKFDRTLGEFLSTG